MCVGSQRITVQRFEKYNYFVLSADKSDKSSEITLNKCPFFVILKLANKIIECQNGLESEDACERRGLES
ncbi:hypothetical protein A4H02_00170 [Fervidobacterium thailandense]|uniref:Uncharacterized protein n=1 Tax=Fervidobacterium thailandense TaxID=1008305 RepID=A0A1E3G4Q8_9BACT|nr:hypothetical protein A4H02_00170 [Fervidobacterium thailandense]